MLMTREQIKEHLQIGEFTLRKLVRTRKIPFVRINNTVLRFDAEKVDAALTANFENKEYTQKGKRSAKANLIQARTISNKPQRPEKP